jgi:hypothetical protein
MSNTIGHVDQAGPPLMGKSLIFLEENGLCGVHFSEVTAKR